MMQWKCSHQCKMILSLITLLQMVKDYQMVEYQIHCTTLYKCLMRKETSYCLDKILALHNMHNKTHNYYIMHKMTDFKLFAKLNCISPFETYIVSQLYPNFQQFYLYFCKELIIQLDIRTSIIALQLTFVCLVFTLILLLQHIYYLETSFNCSCNFPCTYISR